MPPGKMALGAAARIAGARGAAALSIMTLDVQDPLGSLDGGVDPGDAAVTADGRLEPAEDAFGSCWPTVQIDELHWQVVPLPLPAALLAGGLAALAAFGARRRIASR